jgi:hypothetical protein
MPIPNPKPEETADIYIGRCIKTIYDEYGHERATAICKSKWENKNMKKQEKEELFVLTPRKTENRGSYLSRCSAHTKMKEQFPNMRERMGSCLNSFNSYYKYWSRLDEFAEVPEDTTLGVCIAKEKAKGFDYKEAYAHCASKVVVAPGPVVLSEEDNLIVEPVAFGMDVSVDFDDTFDTEKGRAMVQKLIDEGNTIHIVTRRQQRDSKEVYDLAKEFGIGRDMVHFTNGKLKWEMIKALGIKRHIDNNPDEIKAIEENLPDVEAIKFYDVNY